MEYKSKKRVQSIILWTLFYALQFKVCFTFARMVYNETEAPVQSPNPGLPSYYFLVEGDIVENGFINATLRVGNDAKPFVLDIDTGSDLTWISCSPTNIKFLKPLSIDGTPNDPYVTSNNFVSCVDASICGFIEKPINSQCSQQIQQCDYQVEYADHGTSLGVLVKDTIVLSSSLHDNPLQSTPNITFGCGYHQEFSSPPSVDGVLGLGSGETSILSQLSGQGRLKKIVALCLSDKDGPGYLVLGDSLSPHFTWKSSSNDHMQLGPADILYDYDLVATQSQFLLDSGTTYNYFSSSIYQAILYRVKQTAAVLGTPVVDQYLPVCWKPIASSRDFLEYSEPILLSFTADTILTFLPFDYFVISPQDNVCLGILESKELGSGFENLNIIGGLPLQSRLVVFDYENQEIGWEDVNCNDLPLRFFSKGRRTNPLKKMKGKLHKRKDIARWHMRKKRKMQHY